MATRIFISEVACWVGFHSCKYIKCMETHMYARFCKAWFTELNWIELNWIESNQIELIWYDMIWYVKEDTYICMYWLCKAFFLLFHEQGIAMMGYVGLEIWIWVQ